MLSSESGDVAGVHRSHNDGAYQNSNNGNADGIRATAASPYSSQGPRSIILTVNDGSDRPGLNWFLMKSHCTVKLS